MKKIYLMLLTIVALSCTMLETNAQVNGYTFNSSSGTYSEISGGTVLGTTSNDDEVFNNSTTGASSPVSSTGFPIGFNITYAGVSYDRFAVNTNGFIVLGTGTFSIGGTTTSVISSTSADLTKVISGFNQDLTGQTGSELSYLLTGSSPSRVMVIQWKNYKRYNGSGTMNFNFQIRLSETSNEVQIVYGTMTTATSYEAQVGLKGNGNSDYNIRTTSTNWAATTAGASNSATNTLSSTVFPASGQTFAWAPNTAAVDWCNLQWPPTATISSGNSVLVYARAWEPGVTDAPGAGANLLAWIGVYDQNTNPATWPASAWKAAAYNVDDGNNDEDSTSIGRTLGAGTYYYASRWQVNGGEFRYGGYNAGGGGFWDGTANVSGVLTINPSIANDVCSGAIAIPCGGSVSGDNTNASADALPGVTCGSTTTTTGTNRGLWYTITPANSGSLTISTCTGGTQWDTYLRAYTGSCGSFTACAGSDDDGCSESTYGLSQLTFTATAGTTYYILLGGYDNTDDFGTFTISATCPAACPGATGVSVGSITSSGASVTWSGTGTFILEYGPAGFTPGTGTTAGGGTVINPATSAQAIGSLTASTGYDVYIRQDCTGTGAGYSANSSVVSFTTLSPAPANDNCATATVINTLPYSFSQADGSGATQTAFVSACGSGMNDGVWYSLTGTGCNITVTIDPTTSWDPELGIYTGTCGAFTCVDFADDGGSGGAETITFNAAAGTVYYINIGYYSGTTDSPEGPFDITVSGCVTPPANDECGAAVPIGIAPIGGTTVNGTESLPAGTCDTDTQSPNDVWYQFTTISAGDAIITVANTTGDVVVEAFTGTCGGTLTSIGCADNSFATENLTLTGLTAGQTVYVRVYGYEEDQATFDISVSGAAMPVTIEYFRGTKQNSRNVLDWKVSCTGSPSVTMVLERSSDARHFESIYTATETATRCLQPFAQNDLQPLPGINYYRLKTIDVDGKISYSNTVALLNKDKGFEIVSIAPNPVRDAAVLNVTSAQRDIMEIVITDINGKQISKQRVSLVAGNNQVSLNLGHIAAGTYQVSGLTADGSMRTLKFVKQ
ncbi:MAG: T9SS type A sorting domain-containing protein [Ferruginibacter sp.]